MKSHRRNPGNASYLQGWTLIACTCPYMRMWLEQTSLYPHQKLLATYMYIDLALVLTLTCHP